MQNLLCPVRILKWSIGKRCNRVKDRKTPLIHLREIIYFDFFVVKEPFLGFNKVLSLSFIIDA